MRWFHYYNIEPFGSIREDFRTGQICATAANLMQAGGDKQLEATDFVPTYDSEIARIEAESVSHMNNQLATQFRALKALSSNVKRVNK